ncbi:MAG: Prenyltransferase/squalene oxidase, partial [Planctomycetaceae bacterium]|nr:Prenyltransferase/squalene oxidase [Planctomycetaceae bacterium]
MNCFQYKFQYILGTFCLMLAAVAPLHAQAPEKLLTEKIVKRSIEKGQEFLLHQQGQNGAWTDAEYAVGKTSLALLTLINCGMTLEDEPVQRALTYLRGPKEPSMTYEVSLKIMALAAAKDGNRDATRILGLATKLAGQQKKNGDGAGGWSYNFTDGGRVGGVDRSNAQFAVLGLREAQYANIAVDRAVWELIRDYWTSQQSTDGGWNYNGSGPNNNNSTGSMTVA